MKKFLLLVLIWFLSFCQADAADFVHLTIESDPAVSRTISWRSYEDEGAVVSCTDAAGKIYCSQPKVQSYIIEGRTVWFYTARLADLMPGQYYEYRIHRPSGENLAVGHFKTASSEKPVKFLLFGDSQSIDYGVWRRTLQEAVDYHGTDADFFVNNGDLVDNGSQYAQWYQWFKNGEGILADLSIVPVVGNHETFAADYRQTHSFSMPELFTRQFALPHNGPAGLKEQVFSFDYGNVHIAVLDTQFAEERAFLPDSWQRQLNWLANDLALSDKRWKLVFMHKPVYHNRSDSDRTDSRFAELESVLQQGGADVVFTAHDHVLARTTAVNGIVYIACGRSGTKAYQTKEAKAWNDWFFNPVDEPVYMVVNIEEGGMIVEAYGWNNKQLVSWQLSGR